MNISEKAWIVGYKIMGGAIVFMIVGAIVLVSLNNAQLRAENQDMYADLQASQDNAQSLYEQLLAEGVEPEGEPPAQVSTLIPENGRDGDDGARGERGPGPTGEQVLDGIRACFAAGTCTAPKGDMGDPGTNGTNGINGTDGARGSDSTVPGPVGATGVGIASITCLDDGTWEFTMTDGTSRDVPGPCRTVLVLEPTPEPTPEGEPAS
ncbi:hypothetical protein [Microbacterium sp. K24]|uniref:hypothetical protein n=1 Tax=Microbacterium sp. K24 TaxID=2305446 RepID=UPI00109D0AD2|nr:hypothetical protein [Microbacterium sp. K24]